MFKILRRSKVTASMSHVILETIGLLVRLVTVGLRAFEWLGEKQRRSGPGKCRRSCGGA